MPFQKYLFGLVLTAIPFAAFGNACYYPYKNSEGARIFIDDCGALTDPYELSFLPEHIDNIQFDENGLACLGVADSDKFSPGDELVFWVHRSGKHIRTQYIEMGCAYYHEGLSVGMRENQNVYINNTLDVVLEPDFDYLGDFQDGLAIVCNGSFTYEAQGARIARKGAQCGMINSDGEVVLKAEHPIEKHDVFDEFRRSYVE